MEQATTPPRRSRGDAVKSSSHERPEEGKDVPYRFQRRQRGGRGRTRQRRLKPRRQRAKSLAV